jgi:hypothetical protein
MSWWLNSGNDKLSFALILISPKRRDPHFCKMITVIHSYNLLEVMMNVTDFMKEITRYDRNDIALIIDKYAKPPKLIRVVTRVREDALYEKDTDSEAQTE